MRKTVAGLVFAVWCAVIAGTWNSDDAKMAILTVLGIVMMAGIGIAALTVLFAKERE